MEKFVCGAYNRCQLELSTLFPQTIADGDGREEDEGICLPRVGVEIVPVCTRGKRQCVYLVGKEPARSSLVTSGVRPKLQALSTWNVHGPKQRPRCNPGVFTVLALLLILQHSTPHTTYRLQQHVFPSARQSSRPRESGRGSSPFGPMRHSSEAVESSFHQALAPKRPRPESLGSLSAQSAHRECRKSVCWACCKALWHDSCCCLSPVHVQSLLILCSFQQAVSEAPE
ncbi:hypothetical protein HDV62DRAFT_265942 [Trichoderma sp. SZMC 28011]